jgi:hypothetical protein
MEEPPEIIVNILKSHTMKPFMGMTRLRALSAVQLLLNYCQENLMIYIYIYITPVLPNARQNFPRYVKGYWNFHSISKFLFIYFTIGYRTLVGKHCTNPSVFLRITVHSSGEHLWPLTLSYVALGAFSSSRL